MLIKEKNAKKHAMVKLVVCSLFCVSLFAYLDSIRKVVIFSNTKQEVREEITHLYSSIELNADKQNVLNIMSDFSNKHKGFSIVENKELIELRAPIEIPKLTFFWIIYVFFDKGNVSGVAIRPIDNSQFWLCGAPSDKGVIPDTFKKVNSCI